MTVPAPMRAYMGLGVATLYRGAHVWLVVEPRKPFEIERLIVRGSAGPYAVDGITVDGTPLEVNMDVMSADYVGHHTRVSGDPIVARKSVAVKVRNEGPGGYPCAVGLYGCWRLTFVERLWRDYWIRRQTETGALSGNWP